MRNTPVTHVVHYTNIRTNVIEVDPTSIVPSIAAMSMRGIVDPRLKHNNGQNVPLNIANDPVELGRIAENVRDGAERLMAAASLAPEPQPEPKPEPTE